MKKIRFYKVIFLSIILLVVIIFFVINCIYFFSRGISTIDLNITHRVVNLKNYGAKLDGVHFDDKALNDAIKSIKEGTVYIPQGTLLIPNNVTITVPKGISIKGDGFNKTTIKQINGYPSNRIFNCMGQQKIQEITIDSKLGIKPGGDNLEILKCKFINGIQSIQIIDTVNKLTINDCVFENNPGYGILFNFKPSYDCLIINCQFVNTIGDFIEINAPCERIKIENCTYKDNYCTKQSAGFGIGVAVKAKQIKINNCSFNDIYGQGIHVEDNGEVSITNCNFRNCGNASYPGSPKSDISVLSGAKVDVSKCIHYEPEIKYSETALFCSGAIANANECTYYKRSVGYGLHLSKCRFYGDATKKENQRLQTAVKFPGLTGTVTDCEFYNYNTGIIVGGGTQGNQGGHIKDCFFSNCNIGISQGKTSDSGLYLNGSGEDISGCKFLNNTIAINLPNGEVAPRGYYSVINNEFSYCKTNSILASFTPNSRPVVKNNMIIDKNNNK